LVFLETNDKANRKQHDMKNNLPLTKITQANTYPSSVAGISSLLTKKKNFMKKILASSTIALAILSLNLFFTTTTFAEIAIRGTNTTGSSTNTNLIINKPTGVAVGDVMIVNIVKYGSATTPSLAGWTLISGTLLGGSSGGTSRYGAILYRVVTGTEGANFTFALGTNSYAAGSILAFSGVDVSGATPFDVAPGSISTPAGTAGSVTVTSITTNTPNAAVIMFGMNSSNPARSFATWTTASPTLAEIYDYTGATYETVGAAWAKKPTAGSTGTSSLTLSGTGAYVGGILIALKAIPIPTITSLGSTSSCPGTNITINGTNLTGATAADVKIGGTAVTAIVSNNGTQIEATIGSGTTGNVTVTTGGGTATSSATFTVNALPVITGQPASPAAVCAGTNSSTFTVTATGTGLTYQWQRGISGTYTDITAATAPDDGATYSNYNTAILTIANAPIGMNGYTYRCVVSGTCSPSVTSDGTAALTLLNNPIVTSPTSASITSSGATLGGNITSIGCSDVIERGIYWSTTDGFADGTGTKVSETPGPYTSGVFTIPVTDLAPNTVYYYKAFATNSGGTTYSAQETFTTLCEAAGNPADFGSNVWNVYGYDGANMDLSGITYRGYYTVAGTPSFNSTDSWTDTSSPSSALSYQGCPVVADAFTFVHKRQGFTCGTYQIDCYHDDDARLYIDDVLVWSSDLWGAVTNIWTGVLDENSTVEYRVMDGAGPSSGALTFTYTPAADFSGTPTSITPGSTVAFTDLSTGTVTSRVWTFEGGNPSTSTDTNPVVTYNTPGTYDVSLTVTSFCGEQTTTKANYITVGTSNSVTFTSSNPAWAVPCGVTSITVECWGGGGAGGSATGFRAHAGGGAGGAYVKKVNISVIPGSTHPLVVGGVATASSNAVVNGNPSSFDVNVVVASGGAGGLVSSGATSNGGLGSTTGCIGDAGSIFAGGNGGNGTSNYSGGGGGGAGSSGAGNNATAQTAGGTRTEYGGSGGNGVNVNDTRNAGSTYGGGGSGGFAGGNPDRAGGNGAAGFVRITYIQAPPPTVSITGPNSICVDGRTNLSPTTGGTWASSSGAAQVLNDGTVIGLSAGSATFTFTETATGCSSTTAAVTIYAKPTQATAGADQSIAGGLPLTSGSLGGNAPVGVETGAWSQVSGPSTASFSNSGDRASTATVTAYGTYTFRWTISNANCSTSDDITVSYSMKVSVADGSWSDANTWNPVGVPISSDDVTVAHAVTIGNGTTGVTNNLTVSSGKSLTIAAGGALTVSGDLTNNGTVTINSEAAPTTDTPSDAGSGSLIVNGTSTGNVTYNRYVESGRWYITASPVDVYTSNSFVAANEPNIKKANDGTYDFATLDEGVNDWSYPSSITDPARGKGYLTRLKAGQNNIVFTGTLNTGVDASVASTVDVHGWNAIGNPFTSSIGVTDNASSVQNFLTVNSAKLIPDYAAIYVWNQTGSYNETEDYYKVISNSGYTSPDGYANLSASVVQAGQGFLVNVSTDDISLSFTRQMQLHNTTESLKSAQISWPGITLKAENSGNTRTTVVAFNSNMTEGIDKTYDAGLFSASDFNVYTHLANNMSQTDLAIQCLPEGDWDKLSVPIGLDLPDGGEVTFKAAGVILPDGLFPVIEDRQLKRRTSLKSETDSYKVTLTGEVAGTGRFYLHIGGVIMPEDPEELINTRYSARYDNDRITIFGNVAEPTKAILYDLMGRKLGEYPLLQDNYNDIPAVGLTQRVYLLRLEGKDYRQVIKVPVAK
jgi:PKD repeat protein